jgi:Secretion system C-terminal sorting domain
MAFVFPKAVAQCPVGSTINTAGTYTNGNTVCITTSFSGNLTVNNGATMVITNGGNYTGVLSANNGSVITIQSGGILAASTANNFAGAITNNGTVNMTNISLTTGAAITNSGVFNWLSNWNQNVALTVSNTGCGTMNFSTSTNVNSGANILNSGILNFTQDLSAASGSTINNRGRVTVSGNFTSSGLFYNQYKAVFKGGSNTINSGDSIINLAYMTFSSSLTSNTGIRNEGLFTVGGSYTKNGGTFLINNTNAQLRVKGALSNSNSTITGSGSMHVAGSIANSNTVSGVSAAKKLTVNQAPGGTTSNLIINAALVAVDTAAYVASMANPAVCSVLPMQLSSLQAVYQTGQVQLNWYTYATSNARSFTIEYSPDGRTYATAGQVTATTASNETTRYQFVHYTNLTGTIYYRIRETDANGTVYYSNTLLVKAGNAANTSLLVFPNPFTSNVQINLQLEKTGTIQIALYDAGGRLTKKLERQGMAGNNTIVINDLSALQPGVYLIKITTGDRTVFEKLIK